MNKLFFALLSIFLIFGADSIQAQCFPNGNALDFDGVNDYISAAGTNFNLTNITIEAWVYRTSNNSMYVASKYSHSGSNAGYFLMLNFNINAGQSSTGVVSFALGQSYNSWNGANSGTNTVPLNTWTHIAGTYDGATIKVYINGSLAGSNAYNGGIWNNTSLPFLIGDRSDQHFYFNGKMDEVRVWSVARTQTEINDNKNLSLTSGTGLVASYNFTSGSAGQSNTGVTTLADQISSANNGTLINFALTGATSNWVASACQTPTPSFTVSGTLTAFTKCLNQSSAYQSFSLTGSNLQSGFTITPPVGFEVSASTDFSSVGTNSIPLTVGTGGSPAITIYVRMQSSANNLTYAASNIVCSSTGATSQNVSCQGVANTPVYSYNIIDGSWEAASNWNQSCNNGASYTISSTVPTTPSISYINANQTVTANDLTISAQNQLIVKSGGKLTVTGNFVNNGGYFKVESGGSLVQSLNSSQTGAGTYVAERYMSGSGGSTPNGRFWYMGVPMTGATSTAVDALSPGNKLWSHSETSGNYTEITANGVPLTRGAGYVFRGGNNATYSFTSSNIGNGDFTFSLSRSSGSTKPGFNLISNPYPSHLSWDQLWNSTLNAQNQSLILPTVWYRSATSSNSMVFDTYNATVGVGTNNTGTSLNGTAVTGSIAPFQSFWVRVAEGSATATMTATNSMRSHGTQNFLTQTPALVRLNLSNGTYHDQAIVVLNEDLSNDYDYRDSDKEIPSATVHQIYSLEGTKKVVINGIANAITKDTLQLGVQIPTAGTYSINCSELTFSDLVYLEDKLTDAYVLLDNTSSYSFTSVAGTIHNRFVLHFVPNVPGQTAATAIPMSTSNWPQCNNESTADQWHAFTATSEAVSIAVNTTTTDITIELQDGTGNVVAQENAVNGIGNETLNFFGLTAGQTYKVGVRNANLSQGTGTYGICVRSLKRGGCDYGAGPYSLCQYYKATWAGSTGVSYTFTFTGTSGPAQGQTFTRTQNSDICVLSTVTPLLPYGSTYDVTISNTYTLTDGAGNTEQITVPSNSGCQVITIAQPQTTLSASSSCNNGPRFRGAVVSSMPWVCGANNWRWRFTEVNPLTLQAVGLPIELNRGAASNYLNLGTVNQLQNGKTYAVETAPLFTYTASNYQWGPTQYMCIVGAAQGVLQDAEQGVAQGSTKDAMQGPSEGASQVDAMVYVTEGNHVNIQLTNTESNTAKRADIYDVTGKLVKSVRLVEGMNTVAIDDASGIYMVRTTVGEKVETQRVFLKK